MQSRAYATHNGAGWVLDVRRFWTEGSLDTSRRPVLLIPGYCMNTFVLSFHPEGRSMIEYLTDHGYEVWTADLRGQGESRSIGGVRNFGFDALALGDLPKALATVREHTQTERKRVDIIGCSLGGTFVFAYLAHNTKTHGIGSVVGMGAPLRWDAVHPVLGLVFKSPRLAAALNVSGTRRAARFALPIARRIPGLLDIYMNTKNIDLSQADELVKTVDDPIRQLNFEIAHWIKARDLTVAGVNVTDAMRHIDRPLLCVLANGDGIVPPEAALSATRAFGGGQIDVLNVGDDEDWFAHADLFISRHAERRVFEPLASWLQDRNHA